MRRLQLVSPLDICTAWEMVDIVKGYFTTGHRMTEEELQAVKGRSWEEYDPETYLTFVLLLSLM